MQHIPAARAVCLFADAAMAKGLIDPEDRDFCVNTLLSVMALDAPEDQGGSMPLLMCADVLHEDALARGLVEQGNDARDRFMARLFGTVTPAPAVVRARFSALEKTGIQAATDWFYALCRDADYIRTREIARNVRYESNTPAGTLEITINLSKPEKDPRDIAAALTQKAVSYPKCQLCAQNPGYAGRPGFPARQNHRIIPLALGSDPWYFQYSPYLYYDEHCIVFNRVHEPMRITRESLSRMADFVDRFPHYFIGSNADLPIVGGSILTHDHFQGGRHVFPLERAATWFAFDAGVGITARALTWPTTCLVLESADRERLIAAADHLLTVWRGYDDPEHHILARTDQPHNTITPVLRKQGHVYRLYIMLRNNRTTPEHPLGLFHPHQDKHHIKKENIGLIEAMGLFILPGRLLPVLDQAARFLALGEALPDGSPHTVWAESLRAAHPNAGMDSAPQLVRDAVGDVCYQVLVDTGVYKQDDEGRSGLARFLHHAGFTA